MQHMVALDSCSQWQRHWQISPRSHFIHINLAWLNAEENSTRLLELDLQASYLFTDAISLQQFVYRQESEPMLRMMVFHRIRLRMSTTKAAASGSSSSLTVNTE